MRKTTVVKFPIDILENLKRNYPGFSNPAKIRIMYNEFVEMQELKEKIKRTGEIIYGKNNWNKKFKNE